MSRGRIRVRKSEYEYYFLILYLSISPISKLLEKFWIPRPVTYMVMILGCAVYILNHFNYLKRKPDVLLAFMILTPITLFGVLMHYSDFNGANEMYAMIIIFYPAYFIMRAANIDKLIRALRVSAYIGIAIYLPNAFLVENIRSQYMTYAYDILFPLSIIVFYAVNEKHWYDITISIVGTILLAIFGSRGALISLALFFVFIIIDKNKLRRTILVSFLVVLLVIVYSNLSGILTWLSQFGISSYSLNRIINGEAFTSYARDGLYQYITTNLIPNNYFGYGPIGNRSLMPVVLNHDIRYPHQLFFELLIDYGIIIGGFFSLAIIFVTAYMVFKSKKEYRYLTALYCVVSLFPLMISGTFYTVGTIPYIFAIFMKLRDDKKVKPVSCYQKTTKSLKGYLQQS